MCCILFGLFLVQDFSAVYMYVRSFLRFEMDVWCWYSIFKDCDSVVHANASCVFNGLCDGLSPTQAVFLFCMLLHSCLVVGSVSVSIS